ncbi:MAG TPA: succinate dehydrogenase, cytochrome b556 subunit [Anaerolineaceae bacterium]|jgi:succinate dehydrogenase / fumarate reductase cytochrome b subunit
MSVQTRASARRPANWAQWLDPRHRQIGMWAFVMNRLSALGLTFYLFLHLYALHQLAQGPQVYDGFIALVRSPIFTLGELVVVVAGLYHGLNGVRVILTSLGIAVPYQRTLFWVLFGIAALGSLAFAIRMFSV